MTAEEMISQAARILVREAGPDARVILFGSHARGNARPGSDLDFLVIEPEVDGRHREMVRLRRSLRGIDASIDVWSTARTRRGPGGICRARRFTTRCRRAGCSLVTETKTVSRTMSPTPQI